MNEELEFLFKRLEKLIEKENNIKKKEKKSKHTDSEKQNGKYIKHKNRK